MLGGEVVQHDRHLAHALHQHRIAGQLGRPSEVDRLVVADIGVVLGVKIGSGNRTGRKR